MLKKLTQKRKTYSCIGLDFISNYLDYLDMSVVTDLSKDI